jgi:hypothetical protein
MENKKLDAIINFCDDDTVAVIHCFMTFNPKLLQQDEYTVYKDLLSYAENVDLTFNTNHKQTIVNAHYDYLYNFSNSDEVIDGSLSLKEL